MQNAPLDLAFDDLETGHSARVEWTVAEAELDAFAALSGDRNPLHMDPDYARGRGFPGRVAHGGLLAAKLSGLVGMVLPGRRCLLVDESLEFVAPVLVGDTVTIAATVKERWPDFSLLKLGIKATKPDAGKNRTVARGSVTCKILY